VGGRPDRPNSNGFQLTRSDWYQDVKRKWQMRDIIGPVRFEHHDGGVAVLNNGRKSVSLVVVLLGPDFDPGTNGPPIRREPPPEREAMKTSFASERKPMTRTPWKRPPTKSPPATAKSPPATKPPAPRGPSLAALIPRLKDALAACHGAEHDALNRAVTAGALITQAKDTLAADKTNLQSWTQWFRANVKGFPLRSAATYEKIFIHLWELVDGKDDYRSIDDVIDGEGFRNIESVLRHARGGKGKRPRYTPAEQRANQEQREAEQRAKKGAARKVLATARKVPDGFQGATPALGRDWFGNEVDALVLLMTPIETMDNLTERQRALVEALLVVVTRLGGYQEFADFVNKRLDIWGWAEPTVKRQRSFAAAADTRRQRSAETRRQRSFAAAEKAPRPRMLHEVDDSGRRTRAPMVHGKPRT
jgi:hypothetical protein